MNNYHTHTIRCNHAEGTDREYVEGAVKAGIKILGFSDHTPMVYATKDYYPNYKMRPEQAQGYFESLLLLKEEYKDKIEIHIGFETEYYPEAWASYKKMISVYPVEYLILGQHFLWKDEDGDSVFNPSDSTQRLISYYENLYQGVQTGLFSYIAHPDALHYTGEQKPYEEITMQFLQQIKQTGIPLGLNRYGLADNRHYPNPLFWRLAGKVGVKGIIEFDAHSPDVFADTKSIDLLHRFAEQNGVELLEELKLPTDFRAKLLDI